MESRHSCLLSPMAERRQECLLSMVNGADRSVCATSRAGHPADPLSRRDDRLGRLERKEPRLDDSRVHPNARDDIRNVYVVGDADVQNAMTFVGHTWLSVAHAQDRIESHLSESLLEHIKRKRGDLDRKSPGPETFDDFRIVGDHDEP